MHVATKQHLVGMLTMIRQACHSIEAAIAGDGQYGGAARDKTSPNLSDEETDYFLSRQQEDMLGELLGLSEEKPTDRKPKRAKALDEKLPTS